MTRTRALAVCLLALASLTACSSGSASAEGQEADGESLNVGLIGAVSEASVYHAMEEGLFEEKGLNITTTLIANPAAMVAAAQSGELDVAFVPAVPYINAAAQGVPLTAVAGMVEVPEEAPEKFLDGGIYVNPDSGIKELADLEGRTIAVPARKGTLEVETTAALDKVGVDPASVQWVSLDPGAAVESINNGRVDAAFLFSPFNGQADKDGMKLIGQPGKMWAGAPTDVFAAGQQAVDDKAEALRSFREVLYEANTWANENPEEAAVLGTEKLGLELEASEIPLVKWSTGLDADGLDNVAEVMADLGFLTEKPDFSQLILK